MRGGFDDARRNLPAAGGAAMSRRLTAALGLGLWLAAVGGLAALAATARPEPANPASPHYVVFYFHGKFRCPTCLKIERLAAEAVRDAYADYLDQGKVQWRAVDIDRPEHRHYSAEFELETSTLAVARLNGDKVAGYAKLERVWELVDGDETEFARYVQDAIDRFMAE